MNKYFLLLFLSIIFFSCTKVQDKIKHQSSTNWYKGNLHTHSYWSDGDEFPEMIMDWYKSNGYHFVALSDHNILAAGEKWKRIPTEKIYRDAFDTYLKKYGEDWVSYRVEKEGLEVKLKTFDEYRSLFEEEEQFLILQAEEITDRYEDKPIHLNATNLQKLIEPQGGNNVVEVLQNNIDAVNEQRAETGVPVIPHINHPNFYYAISLQDLIQLSGERFFEVFNGHAGVHNLGDSIHMGTEEMWDKVNIAYLKQGKPLMYGLATDDSHNYHQIGSKWHNAGRGWIMVKAERLEAAALIEAMEQGDFYASTGVVLHRLDFDQNTLSIEVETEADYTYKIVFIGANSDDKVPTILQESDGPEAEYRLSQSTLFVRAIVLSSKKPHNPIETFENEMAWTQPIQFQP